MSSLSNSKSLPKASERERVSDGSEHRLYLGLPPPQGVAADGSSIQIDFAAHQSMRPQGIEQKGMAEQLDLSAIGGASQKEEATRGRGLQVQLPALGKGPTFGSRLDAPGSVLAASSHVLGRLGSQRLERLVMKAGPDLGLPSAIEALDGGLKARLAGRDKDGHHLQAEAQALTELITSGCWCGP